MFHHFSMPHRRTVNSIRLKDEIKRPIRPYFALGFDQHVVAGCGATKSVTMDELLSLKHLCRYGRPLYAILLSQRLFYSLNVRWNAMFPQIGQAIITEAALRLTNGKDFDYEDTNHVLAVLSHRLCVDPVIVSTEATRLSDRSVAHHMRLYNGMSPDGREFYSHSPSEPILALGAASIMYEGPKCLRRILQSFSLNLCRADLVGKGLAGELGARTILLIARDFCASTKSGGSGEGRDLRKYVCLLDFLDSLFGNKTWCGDNRLHFEGAFRTTYINFTHWTVTKDPLPEVPDM
jgi:hypothetical protein